MLAAAGCKPERESEPPTPTDEPDPGGPTSPSDPELVGAAQYVGHELPAPLLGELRDAEGRIVVLAPGFVAASACIDCGAPTYLWFLAVRCTGETDCEVLTESCEGKIASTGSEFTLAFVAIEGTDPNLCANYSGSFIKPE